MKGARQFMDGSQFPPKPDQAPNMASLGSSFSETVTKLHETAVASGAVISHRMSLAVAAAANPAVTDHDEFKLMTTEKIDGFSASASAVMGGACDLGNSVMTMLMAQSKLFTQAMTEATTSLSPFGFVDAHQRWVSESIASANRYSLSVAGQMLETSASALDPLHSRATGNARRLSGLKKAAE